MTGLPLVTICMPTYNHEAYIEDAILSIINQDFNNIQLIISDDGSTDNTFEIARHFEQKYPNIITLQRHATNVGLAANVDSIYPLIDGKYVCWFSGDDLYAPNKVSSQLNYMETHKSCIFSFHQVQVINDTGKNLYEFNDKKIGLKNYTYSVASNLLRHRCYICAISVMINRELSAGIRHNEIAGPASDWLLLFELANRGEAHFIPEVLGSYRRHKSNLTKNIDMRHEVSTYNYVLRHYSNYADDVYLGLANLYTGYFFKYLYKLKFASVTSCVRRLALILISHPKCVKAVVFKIGEEMRKRLLLYRVTGGIQR